MGRPPWQTADLTIIDQQESIDPVADQVQQAIAHTYKFAGENGQAVMNFLHGTWLGHPQPLLMLLPAAVQRQRWRELAT